MGEGGGVKLKKGHVTQVWESNGLCTKAFTYMACGRKDVKGLRKIKGKETTSFKE